MPQKQFIIIIKPRVEEDIGLDSTSIHSYECGILTRILYSVRQWNTGLVSSGVSLTSWEEGASLALVSNPSSDDVTIKMPYGVDVIFFPIGLVKTNSDVIFRSVETGLGINAGGNCDYCWCLSFFLAFSDLAFHLKDVGVGVFWVHCAAS